MAAEPLLPAVGFAAGKMETPANVVVTKVIAQIILMSAVLA